ncbi:DMT family transporter [Streptomyces sp. NPDC055966]|uniref:DMT family transporter n=1 Tax=Streptomyces sp. NPDC055966 TaxID=3345669 RepID=UPI0035E1C8DC
MNITVAALLALASVAAYAAAAAMQHRVASTASGRTGLRALLANAAWWVSNAANATGAALHVAALKYGTLTLAQCLGALTVVAAVPLGARAGQRRVTRAEWRGVALTLAGFTALLPLTVTGTGSTTVLSAPAAVVVTAVTCLTISVALSVRGGARRSLARAAASGIASGTGSALTQTVLHTDHLLSWHTALTAVAAVVLALAGLLLSQSAYAGGLGAPLATLTLANPVTAAVIGVSLLGDRIHGGPAGVLLAVAGAALAVRGVLVLADPAESTPAESALSKPSSADPRSTTSPVSDSADLRPAAQHQSHTAPPPWSPAVGRRPHPHLAVMPEPEGRTL